MDVLGQLGACVPIISVQYVSTAQVRLHHHLHDIPRHAHGVAWSCLLYIDVGGQVDDCVQDEASLAIAQHKQFNPKPMVLGQYVLLECHTTFEEHQALVDDHLPEGVEVSLEVVGEAGHDWPNFQSGSCRSG